MDLFAGDIGISPVTKNIAGSSNKIVKDDIFDLLSDLDLSTPNSHSGQLTMFCLLNGMMLSDSRLYTNVCTYVHPYVLVYVHFKMPQGTNVATPREL